MVCEFEVHLGFLTSMYPINPWSYGVDSTRLVLLSSTIQKTQ